MKGNGYFKVRAVAPTVKIGDIDFNISQIKKNIIEAKKDSVQCIVFPELSVTGYTCADLFQQALLQQQAEDAIKKLAQEFSDSDIFIAVGAPVIINNSRYNCAVLICKGKILGIVPKIHIPNYNEFYEKRWFESGKSIKCLETTFAGQMTFFGTKLIFSHCGVKIGIEICEDLWVPEPPSGKLAMAGADLILNLSASDEIISKHDYLASLISQQSARCRCVYAYASAGWGESSTDLVFSGNVMIGYDGTVFGKDKRFTTGCISETRTVDIEKLRLDRLKFNSFSDDETPENIYRIIKTDASGNTSLIENKIVPEYIDPTPFVPKDTLSLKERCEEITEIQAYGLMRRLDVIGCKSAVIGISGGLDSTLALLVTVKAFDELGLPREGIIGVTMPGFATTSRTYNNALSLMKELGVTIMEINIKDAVTQHFKDIDQDIEKYDITYENSQARERTQILMDIANKVNGIVVGTGDMSELALGWCTYNGDHMSMYGVNVSIPKTLVKHLVATYADIFPQKVGLILKDICDTPISPELVPSGTDDISQKTEDFVGPYELHDFFLYHFLRNSFSPQKIYDLAIIAFKDKYDNTTILKWLKVFFRRFFSQQFKRSCMPDGPKVGSVSLSPRGDWRMPSDASVTLWMNQLDDIKI